MNFLAKAALVLALSLPVAAHAATLTSVSSGSTMVGDTNNIAPTTGTSGIASNGAYASNGDAGATDPSSQWVWTGKGSNSPTSAVYTFSFDLTGFDLTTAVLSGVWGVDNNGTVSLNGNKIAELLGSDEQNFRTLHAYGTDHDAFFLAGLNTLTFSLFDTGRPAAFRATAEVMAEVSAVPVPASGVLLFGAVFAAAFAARRRKAA